MDLDIAALRAFVAVIEFGRFGAAADELGVSQQAVSKRIGRLEQSLGARLVRRGHTGAVATTEGAIALPLARAAVDAADGLVAAVRPRSRPLRIDVHGTRMSTIGLVRAFHEARHDPGEHDIEIVTSNGLRSAVPALLRGRIDAAYARVTGPLDAPQLDHTLADLEPAHVVVGPRHRFSGRSHVDPFELAGSVAWMPGNTAGSEWAAFWDEFAAEFGVTVSTGRQAFGIDHLFEEVAASPDLITFVGEGTPAHIPWHLGISRIAVVDPVPAYPMSLLWSRDTIHPLLTELIAHTRSTFRVPAESLWLPRGDRGLVAGPT